MDIASCDFDEHIYYNRDLFLMVCNLHHDSWCSSQDCKVNKVLLCYFLRWILNFTLSCAQIKLNIHNIQPFFRKIAFCRTIGFNVSYMKTLLTKRKIQSPLPQRRQLHQFLTTADNNNNNILSVHHSNIRSNSKIHSNIRSNSNSVMVVEWWLRIAQPWVYFDRVCC